MLAEKRALAPFVGVELHFKVASFFSAYNRCLDEDRLEDWPGFFLEDGCYKVISRENVEAGLPAAMVYHYSRGMLEDRVTSLRGLLTYQFVHTRHIQSDITITDIDGDVIKALSNYAVYHSTEEGQTQLYSVGRYVDEIVSQAAGGYKFKSRVVIPDTSAIQNCFAVPI